MKGMNGVLSASPAFRYAQRHSRFQQEKICHETDDFLVHFDGILLNQAKPVKENERFELLTGLYRQFGAEMLLRLKGQFTLAIWDKRAHKALITSDLLSKRTLYYAILNQQLFYAASFRDLTDLLSAAGHQPPLNAHAVRAMAENGSLPGTMTYLEDVFYLEACQALECDLSSGDYRVVTLEPRRMNVPATMDEAIGQFEKLFSAAVHAQFAKNEEYGYHHYAAISGGMDSRACVLKAMQEKWNQPFVCFNYSPTDSIDHTVSRQIAFDHNLDYLHYPMDAAVFMARLEDAAERNECQQSCIGSTGAGATAQLLDKSHMGIVHVGLCGGELMGDLVEHASPISRVQRITERLGLIRNADGDFRFLTRDYLNNIRACQNFAAMFSSECETVSPFLDEDVVAFITQLNPALLYRRRLYREWMIRHIPNGYPTTMFCGPVSISPIREVVNKLADVLVKRLFGTSKRDMNPFDYWLKTRPQQMANCEKLYMDGLKALPQRAEILEPIMQAWDRGGEARFFALTAIFAIQDILSRFGTEKQNA